MRTNRLEKKVIEEIKTLFKAGLSNKQITEKLDVKKNTVSYYTNSTTKNKSYLYKKKNRTVFMQKVDDFFDSIYVQPIIPKQTRPERTFEYKVRAYFRDKNNLTTGEDMKKRTEQVEQILWPYDGKDANGYEFPYATDAITGLKINVMAQKGDPDACNFDHRLPKCRGGTNDVVLNFQSLHEDVNAIKGKLTNEELFAYCKLITKGSLYQEWDSKDEE
tara:strand:+ start:76 stop:729 length:654 start_codon:yes stop_codon:yes gene_type:complete